MIAKGSDRILRDRVRPASPTVPVTPDAIIDLIQVSQEPAADVLALGTDDKKTRKMEAEHFQALLTQGDPTARIPPEVVRAAMELAEASGDPRAPSDTIPSTNKPADDGPPRKAATTAELMAQVDEAFGDFGPTAPADDLAIPVEAPVQPEPQEAPREAPATDHRDTDECKPVLTPEQRRDKRFAGAIPPITKPPAMRPDTPQLDEVVKTAAAAKPALLPPAPRGAQPRLRLVFVGALLIAIAVAVATQLLR